jgi:predicted cupin superfamily sugar epimerase
MPCNLSAPEIIDLLGLVPHPEGGHYRETFRDPKEDASRASSSAIYFLLVDGETSRWHRVDAAEIWHWYAGSGLKLRLWEEGRQVQDFCLGADLNNGQRPQAVVPAGVWQAANTLGDWTLVGCTVAPAFQFQGFELAPPGWEPGRGGQ